MCCFSVMHIHQDGKQICLPLEFNGSKSKRTCKWYSTASIKAPAHMSSPASLSRLGFPGELNHWWGWELTGLTMTLFKIRESIAVRAEWHLSWQRAQARFGDVNAESIHIVNAESIRISQLQQHRRPSSACCSSSELGGGLGSAPRGPAMGWAWIWAPSVTLLSKMMLMGHRASFCSAHGVLHQARSAPGCMHGFQPSFPLRSNPWVMASSCWDSSAGWQCCVADGEGKQQRAGAEHGVLSCAGWQTGHSSTELQHGTAPGVTEASSPSHQMHSARLYVWALCSKWWEHYLGTLMGLNVSLKVSQLRQSGIPQDRSHCLRVWWQNQTHWEGTTPHRGRAASLHPPMPPPPALPEHCKPCLKPRHRSTWAGQPTQLCVQVWDHAHPPYPVMLGASLTESKDVAKASGPVQNSLIQAYIVCVSDSLFSQHLGTLTLICVWACVWRYIQNHTVKYLSIQGIIYLYNIEL